MPSEAHVQSAPQLINVRTVAERLGSIVTHEASDDKDIIAAVRMMGTLTEPPVRDNEGSSDVQPGQLVGLLLGELRSYGVGQPTIDAEGNRVERLPDPNAAPPPPESPKTPVLKLSGPKS